MAKNKVTVSKQSEFVSAAGALLCKLNDTVVVGTPKQFSTGSIGWNFNGKVESFKAFDLSVTKDEFVGRAGALLLHVNGSTVVGTPKQFSTGSVGWNFNGKVEVHKGEETYTVQVSGNAIVVKSKESSTIESVVKLQVSGNAVVVGSKEW